MSSGTFLIVLLVVGPLLTARGGREVPARFSTFQTVE